MILSRVIEHVKAQNWTAIFIDFVIVVVGVFIGIQVSNWNEARAERVREQSYLVRIRADLQSDIDGLAERLRYWSAVAAAGRAAANYAETGALVDGSSWKTTLAFYEASNIWLYAPNDTTFKEMSSAGDVSLIRKEELRAAVSSYYSDGAKLVRAVVYTNIPEYRQIVRGATPTVVARYIVEHCHSSGPMNQRLVACASPVTEAAAGDILRAYLDHPQLLDRLRFWLINLDQLVQGAAPDDAAARALAAAIDKELAR